MGLHITISDADFSALNLGKIPSVQPFLDAAGLTNQTEIDAVNSLFANLVQAGLWDKIYNLYPLVGGVAASHIYNMKDPSLYPLGFVNDSSAAHGVLGYKALSTTQRYATYTLNFSGQADISFGVYNTSPGGTSSSNEALMKINQSDSGNRIYIARNVTSRTRALIGANNAVDILAASNYDRAKKGFLVADRIGNAVSLYDDGVLIASGTDNTSMTANVSGFLGASDPLNSNAGLRWFTSAWEGFAFIGSHLTAQEHADFYTIVLAFQTALSRA